MYIKEIYCYKSDFHRFTFILTNKKVVFIDFFTKNKDQRDFIDVMLCYIQIVLNHLK